MTESENKNVRSLDTCGLKCPEPVMLLHGAVRDAQVGEKIVVTATDPSTERDFEKFCRFLGHELVRSTEDSGVYTYEIVKRESS